MFSNLVASGGKKKRVMGPTAMFFSVIAHGLLVGGVVYASVIAPKQEKQKAEELVEFLDIKEAEPEAPKPAEPEPPPPPPEEAPKPEAAPPPVAKGFQELIPPETPPAEIKAEDPNAKAISAEDYTGVGVAGGRHDGVVGGVPSKEEAPKDEAPIFTVEETGVSPEMTNKREALRALERNYPRQYSDAGIAGQVTVKFMIDSDGTVPESSVTVLDATNDAFGEAAIKAVSKFKFRPIKYRGEYVRVWATMPITFQPQQ